MRMEPVDHVFEPAISKGLETCRRGDMFILYFLIPFLFLASPATLVALPSAQW